MDEDVLRSVIRLNEAEPRRVKRQAPKQKLVAYNVEPRLTMFKPKGAKARLAPRDFVAVVFDVSFDFPVDGQSAVSLTAKPVYDAVIAGICLFGRRRLRETRAPA